MAQDVLCRIDGRHGVRGPRARPDHHRNCHSVGPGQRAPRPAASGASDGQRQNPSGGWRRPAGQSRRHHRDASRCRQDSPVRLHPGRSDFAYEPATKLAAPQPLVNAIRTVSFPAPGEYTITLRNTITLRTYDSATASAISRAPRCSRISHASAWPCDDRRAIEIGRPRRREWPSAFACGPAALVRSLALVGKSDRLHQTLRPHGRSLTMRKPTAKGSPGPKA